MNSKNKILFQAVFYIGCLYLVYSLMPRLDKLQPFLFSNKLGQINYEFCLNIPSSQLAANANQFPTQVLILPAHLSFAKMIELQAYDLCMRRYQVQTDVGVIKQFSNEKLKMTLGFNYQTAVSRNKDQKVFQIISTLIKYYPFSADQLDENDFIMLEKNLDGLGIDRLLYICLAKKQFANSNENSCLSYENRDDLINVIRGRTHDGK